MTAAGTSAGRPAGPTDETAAMAPTATAASPSPTAATAHPPPLWAPHAWLGGGWAEQVLLQPGADGHWAAITPGVPPPPGATVLPAPVLPGLVDAHSHAFQRAFAGLAERLDPARGAHDDFWSWRDRMYGVALRITPEQLQAVATHLYGELLRGGYTEVCEFHYLHHDVDGRPYAPPLAMAQALAQAAADTGIGLTLLPVLYQRAGFGQAALREDQRRFATTVDRVLALRDGIRAERRPLLQAGVAVHSLRAAPAEAVHALAQQLRGDAAPVHIHVAEQQAEVRDCLAHTGRRPIQWLAAEGLLDARWQLVHATHATPEEIRAVAASGAGVVLCPGTEGNLGDGLCDLPGWLAAGVPISIGSDSQVTRQWPEELRWLEYGQRLLLQRRNVAASAEAQPATAARLFDAALDGGRRAAGFARWGFTPGARADLLVVNTADDSLQGLPTSHLLDGLVFAAPARPFARVMVAGRWAGESGAAQAAPALHTRTMRALWGGQNGGP
jgi:formimidoylglutamate deiminase